MSSPKGPLTVEQGRAMVARARAYRALEITGIVVSGLAIPLFALSYVELRGIDVAVLAGGEARVPYFAWGTILVFVLGTVLAVVMRGLTRRVCAVLEAEQRRRWVEGGGEQGAESADELPGPAGDGIADEHDPPAAAG